MIFRRHSRCISPAYERAVGLTPVILFHDADEGAAMMSPMGRGLPAHVTPVELNEVTLLSFDLMASTLAYGAEQILVLAGGNRDDRLAGLQQQTGYLETLLTGLGYDSGAVTIVDERDPDALCQTLYAIQQREAASFLPVGGSQSLRRWRYIISTGRAPFGAVSIDVDGCTLCLACVGACPAGAFADNPDAPMLSFTEQTCIQCGLCRSTCPGSVITLEPRINFASSANSSIVLKEEAPFECISCGKLFGARSSVERTNERLVKHPMFAGNIAALNRLRMCEECRVLAQFTNEQPMAQDTQRRTTDDYLSGDIEDDC